MTTKANEPKLKNLDGELASLARFRLELEQKSSNSNVSAGILYIHEACRIYMDSGYNMMFNPGMLMGGGLVLLHNGFLDPELPYKAGMDLGKASSVFKGLSQTYREIYSLERFMLTMDVKEAEKAATARMHNIMRFISYGFDSIGSINSITDMGSAASAYTASLLRKRALNLINWARVYNSDSAYARYNELSHTGEFRSMDDERKFGILLNDDELNEFMRKG